MLLDSQNLFSDNQPITTGTINSDNIVYFGKGDVSFAPLLIQVVNDFSNLTSLTVKILTSETEDFSSSEELVNSTLELEELKSGQRFPINYLPKGNKGYMKIVYTVNGTAETTGKITAGVIAADENNSL